jgi:signal transduction histidine kinase
MTVNKKITASSDIKNQQIADILDNLPVGVCVLFMPDELHQQLRFANKYMIRMINPDVSAPELKAPATSKLRADYHTNAFSGVHPDDLEEVIEAFREGFTKQHFQLKPLRLMTSTGNYIWVALDVTHREDLPEGRLFYASYRNVSAELQMQQELAKRDRHLSEALNAAAKANEAKSVFLSSMSHDLRTPLNGIIGYTELAVQERDPAQKQAFLLKIQSSGNLLLDLVNDTLDLSRIESGKLVLKPEAVDGCKYWEEIVTAMEPSATVKKVLLVKDTSTWPRQMLMVDKVQVKKVLLNIISNAIKYTPAGGRVSVKVEALEPPVQGCTRRITVADTGIGMSREFMERMFEPFSQEHRSELPNVTGTGLGLAIVKKIVDFMGGSIQVTSVLHQGTKFVVDLPLQAWDKEGTAEKKEQARARVIDEGLAGHRVLLCEDNYLNAEIAQLLLKNKKVLVEWARDGQEGVTKFKAAAPGYYQLILMDIRMPVLDGLQATQAIRKLDRPDARTIPILAMTADAFDETVEAARKAGMDAYITKPIMPLVLYKTLFEKLTSCARS